MFSHQFTFVLLLCQVKSKSSQVKSSQVKVTMSSSGFVLFGWLSAVYVVFPACTLHFQLFTIIILVHNYIMIRINTFCHLILDLTHFDFVLRHGAVPFGSPRPIRQVGLTSRMYQVDEYVRNFDILLGGSRIRKE